MSKSITILAVAFWFCVRRGFDPAVTGPTARRFVRAENARPQADAQDGDVGLLRCRVEAGAQDQVGRHGARCKRCSPARRRCCERGLLPAEEVEPALRDVVNEVKDKGPGGHILTGPIYIEGAEPGDTLEVRIKEIKLAIPYGYTRLWPEARLSAGGLRAHAHQDHPAR